MRQFRFVAAVAVCAALVGWSLMTAKKTSAAEKKGAAVPGVLSYTMKSIDGKDVELSKYKGRVLLIVNVASKCGKTPQYKGLEALYEKHSGDGLAILGFPCNQFLGQEPGTDAEIKEFCASKYGVKFDIFSKVEVKGDGKCDLYRYLTSTESNPAFGGDIKWNFTKFLISKDGKVVARFEPNVEPTDAAFVKAVEAELMK